MTNNSVSHIGSYQRRTPGSFENSAKAGESAERQAEIAQYISDMALELRNLARSGQLYEVMVALEYAYYEAYSKANKVKVPQAEIEHIRNLENAAAESDASQQNEL